MEDVIVIGGGAAGFFAAINIAEKYPQRKVLILEKSKEGLAKVRISGGGRCNVTNAEFIPSELAKNYPRGGQELRGAFHRFMSGDAMEWFEKRGVPLKIEPDGRVFPQSDTSLSIVNCFLNEVKRLKIRVEYNKNVKNISRIDNYWCVETSSHEKFSASKLIITTGSSPKIWELLERLGHTIIPPVPSLFAFNTPDTFKNDLEGISTLVKVSLLDVNGNPLKINNKRVDNGGEIAPILITHWGFSGPAILRLSAWGARILAEKNYQCQLQINWLVFDNQEGKRDEIADILQKSKQNYARKKMQNYTPFVLPKRLWLRLLDRAGIASLRLWAELTKEQYRNLIEVLVASRFVISGKSTFKEEFVTAGGISLKEVDFRTFQSKILPDVYFAGEILDIDAITGGFNFQNAWTGSAIISEVIFPNSRTNN